jgi:HIRAN domain
MAEPVMFPGGNQIRVVGESYYEDNLDQVCGGRTDEGHDYDCMAVLVAEPTNPYDPNAVAVYVDGRMVGHLPRDAAKAYQPIARRLGGHYGACTANIRGGWDRGGGDTGHYGVVLDLAGIDRCLEAIEWADAPKPAPARRGFLSRMLGG